MVRVVEYTTFNYYGDRMSIADIKYKELIKDIYENGTWDTDLNVRAKYSDGEKAFCKSVFGRQVTFEPNEMPLLTCKKMFPITAIKEMILFWVQQTVKKEDFENVNCKVWDEWFNSDCNLGKSYAYQFESLSDYKELVEVKPRYIKKYDELEIIKSNNLKIDINKNSTSSYVGKIQHSVGYGDYIILDYNDKKFKIQFLNTNFQNLLKNAFLLLQNNMNYL
jgi:hypothetical protein